jgi:hypothetical protein
MLGPTPFIAIFFLFRARQLPQQSAKAFRPQSWLISNCGSMSIEKCYIT